MSSRDGKGVSYLTKGVPRRAVARNLKTFPRSLFSPDGKRGEEREERSSDNVSWCSVPLSHTLEGRKEGRVVTSILCLRPPQSIYNALIILQKMPLIM